MNIKDLYTVNQQTLEVVQKHDPAPLLNELHAYLINMRTAATTELRDTISQTLEKVELQNAQIDLELGMLPHIDYLLENTEMRDFIGEFATTKVRGLINNDPYFASDGIASVSQGISNFLAILRDTNKSLAMYGVSAREEAAPLLTFVFSGDSDASTTAALSYKMTQIDKIMHGFARLTGDPGAFAKAHIQSVSKSSPLSIDIVSAVANTVMPELHAYMVARGITYVLSRIEQIQNIRIQHEDLKNKKMVNEEIEAGFRKLEDEAASKEAIRSFVSEELLSDPVAVVNNDDAGSHEEVVNAVVVSVKTLMNLLNNGTIAKVYIPAKAAEAEPSPLTREKVEEIVGENLALQKKVVAQEATLRELGRGDTEESTP